MKKLLLLPFLALALVACGPPSKAEHYTDQAIRACGQGNVAYVNAAEGRFGCKNGAFSRDH